MRFVLVSGIKKWEEAKVSFDWTVSVITIRADHDLPYELTTPFAFGDIAIDDVKVFPLNPNDYFYSIATLTQISSWSYF